MGVKRKENIQFRILYFLGICLIVAGHCDGLSIPLFQKWFPNYSFHIGLFVFCSGYFFVNNKNKDKKEYILKATKKHLVPLYVWNLIYGIIIAILHMFDIKFGLDLSFKTLFIMPLNDGHQFVLNLSSWFIVPLYFLQVIYIFLIKKISKKDSYFYINFIISLILGFIGVEASIRGYNTGFLLLLVRILYFLPFFSLGMLYKKCLEKKDTMSSFNYFLILFVINLFIIIYFKGEKAYTPSLANDFDNFYRPFIAGFMGIAFWLRCSKVLVPIFGHNKYVMYVSKNTFSIMMHHLTGFFLLNTIFCFINTFILKLPGFDYELYTTSIWYKYLPHSVENFTMVYGVFGIVFSLGVHNFTEKFKEKCIKTYNMLYNKILDKRDNYYLDGVSDY